MTHHSTGKSRKTGKGQPFKPELFLGFLDFLDFLDSLGRDRANRVRRSQVRFGASDQDNRESACVSSREGGTRSCSLGNNYLQTGCSFTNHAFLSGHPFGCSCVTLGAGGGGGAGLAAADDGAGGGRFSQ